MVAGKIDIVRMDVDEGHAAMAGDPLELALPDVDGFLAKQQEKRGILRQSVRKLDISGLWAPAGGCTWNGKMVCAPSGWGSKGSVSKVEAS